MRHIYGPAVRWVDLIETDSDKEYLEKQYQKRYRAKYRPNKSGRQLLHEVIQEERKDYVPSKESVRMLQSRRWV